MFSKLIKNEFVNRWKSILSIYAGLLAASVIMFIFTSINNSTNSSFVTMLYALYSVLYFIGLFLCAASIFFMPLDDFRKRFFKDQGYLTHTLPVKTTSLLMSRMVCDLSMMIGMAIVFPFSICVAAGDFNFFSSVGKFFKVIFHAIGLDASVGISVILFFLLIFASYLFNLWCFNCAYTLGHCLFEKGKRLMSVVFFFCITFFASYISSAVSQAMQNSGLYQNFLTSTGSESIARLNVILLIMTLFMVLCTVGLVAITNLTFKKKLNLE